MRVIAGKARSLQLKTPPGFYTRPTTDIQKETLFNIFNLDLLDATFLDLYAGSGSIGIEALSRGARYVAFVEKKREAINCIKENLHHTKLDENAEVFAQDVIQAIRTLEQRGKTFDFVFMDPPYNSKQEKEALFCLDESSIVNNDTIIVVESSLETNFDYLEDTKFAVFRKKQYKTNQHVFIETSIGGNE